MENILTIQVSDVHCTAYHGLHPEEKIIGNEFLLDAEVDYVPVSGTVTAISDTINYVSLYEILLKEMMQPRELLETLVMEMAERLHQEFPSITRVSVSVKKLHPPIAQFQGNVGVCYEKIF